jgi:ABC-type glycerol-3-phosphate transport system substrate-binding protein
MPSALAPKRVPRRRSTALLALSLAMGLLAAACGGSATAAGSSAGGGGDNGVYDPIIAQIQAAFGTSMVSGSVENGVLKITLVDGAGAGMAGLFMCSNIKPYLKAANLADTKVVIVEQSGAQLATEAVCSK